MLFEIENNEKVSKYDLKFSMKKVELIESYLKETSVLGMFYNSLPSVRQLKVIIAYGLVNEEGNNISIKQGLEIAEDLILQNGLAKINEIVIGVLQRDCGFLFQYS